MYTMIKNTLIEKDDKLLFVVFNNKHTIYTVYKIKDKSILLIPGNNEDPKIELKQDEFKGWYYESKEISIGGPSDVVSHIYPLIAKAIY